MEEYWEAIRLYEEDIIPRLGKNELIDKYLTYFSKKSQDTFKNLVNRKLRLPTPVEKEWLIENIHMYYNHYKELKEEQDRANNQLSLLN